MDHGTADTNACKVSMLWNWDVKDACFISSGWQINNGGMMAASCIGVALLVVALEFLRLLGKQYEAMITAQLQRRGKAALAASAEITNGTRQSCQPPGSPSIRRRKVVMRASPLQQTLRAILYAVTFGVAYIIMLLAMYANGYIIISIIVGAGLGHFLCAWLSCTVEEDEEEEEKKTGGIEELTVCCQ